MIEVKQETMYVMDYKELERLIQAEYSQPDFDIVLSEGWRNDTSYETYVHLGDPMFDPDAVEAFKTTPNDRNENEFVLNDLMLDMAQRGVIPEGDYLIRVMW